MYLLRLQYIAFSIVCHSIVYQVYIYFILYSHGYKHVNMFYTCTNKILLHVLLLYYYNRRLKAYMQGYNEAVTKMFIHLTCR